MNKLILGDCLSYMKTMADNSVDVIFTSPPYNDSGSTENDKENRRHFKYENVEYREDWYEWQVECIQQMLRITKRHILYNVQPILSNKCDVYKLIGAFADKIDNILIWYKPNAQPQHYPHRIANNYEMIIIFKGSNFDKLYITSDGYKSVIVKNINSNHSYSDIHGAVMSEQFCDEIIYNFSSSGETVFDPFMGLGTTGISCAKFGRDFIGCEIYEKYYDIAKRRIDKANNQMSIFDM